jgi:ABC-type nitrate/sulfonate/bicarbonate transport system substrate-binding protein
MMAEKGFKILARSRSLIESPWLGLVASRQKLEKQPEQTRNVLRAMRDVVSVIQHDKPGVVAYIEKNFKVSAANATESYDDIHGVIVNELMMRDEQIRKYLDRAYSRGDIPRPVSVADFVDFSLLKSLK